MIIDPRTVDIPVYTVICDELYTSGYIGLSELSCIDSYHQFGWNYLWYFSMLMLYIHVLDGMKSCYVNMILMLCKYMFTCLFLRYHLSLSPTNIVLMYNLRFIVVYDVCDQYIVLWKYNGKFIWYSVKVKACWCYKYGTQFSCLFKVVFFYGTCTSTMYIAIFFRPELSYLSTQCDSWILLFIFQVTWKE